MKIHAIQTGTVAVKTRQPEGVGHGLHRRMGPLIDREWTEPLPIYAYAIEHPEGVIVVDTGETSRTAEPGYFPRWHPYFRFAVRMAVEPEEEIGPQLESLGISAGDVGKIVLTHMHTDHAGGLHHFPEAEMLVSHAELELATGRMGRINGYLSNRYPSWFDPAPLDLPGEPTGPFPQSMPLTEAGDVAIVALPGHTEGHLGVIAFEDGRAVFMAGDASYSQELMLRSAVDGVSPDEGDARTTIERIHEFLCATPTVYLVAHDPQTGARLDERAVVDPAAIKPA